MSWCDTDPKLRYPMMSRVISYSRTIENGDVEWTPRALSMLERAPDPVIVLSNFIERFSPTMWEGSRATLIERRAKLLHTLDARLGPTLGQFALARLSELENDIDHYRKWEMKYNRSRDESFE